MSGSGNGFRWGLLSDQICAISRGPFVKPRKLWQELPVRIVSCVKHAKATDVMDFDWANWVKLIVGAGIGSALVQGLLPFIRDRYQRKNHAAYMAMRLAVILENFSWACANLIQGNGNAPTHPDEEYPDCDFALPELPPYPDDAEGWRSVDRELVGRCLGLRNRLLESQSNIRIAVEFFNDEEEARNTVDHEAAKRGLEAWDIAVALRRKHGVENVEPEWDYVDFLKQALEIAENERIAHRKASYTAFQARGKKESEH